MKKILCSALLATCGVMSSGVVVAGSIDDAKPMSPKSVLLSQQTASLVVVETVAVKNGTFSIVLPNSVGLDSFVVMTNGIVPKTLAVSSMPVAMKDFPLVQQKSDIEKKIAQTDVKIAALDARIKVLSTSQQVFTSSKDIANLDTALGNRFETLYTQKNVLVQQKTDLNKTLQNINNALVEATGSTNPSYKKVLVTLTSGTINGSKEITYSYVVYNAGWKPVYQVEGDITKKAVVAKFSAELWQKTGVSWKNIPVTITTAQNTYGVSPAPLPMWNVSTYKPQPRPKAVQYDNSVRTLELSNNEAPVASLDNTTAVQWKVGTRTLTAGTPLIVGISTTTLGANFVYKVVPYTGNEAFLTADITPANSTLFLPSGEANFSVGGINVGKGYFSYQRADKNQVFFGADPLVTATMVLEKDTLVTEKKEQVRTWKWNITVQNMRKAPVSVVVEDTRPRTTSPQVAISFAGTTPMPQVEATAVTWKIPSLQSKKTSTIMYTVTATAPLDVEITSQR